jgi:hypothetical protein
MSWTIYTTDTGKPVEVWLVTDQNETPEGAIAGVGQVVVRERIIFEGKEQSTSYVMDSVPANWKLDGSLPPSVPANQAVVYEPPPEQYLWEMSIAQLRKLAKTNGLEMKKNAIKRDYVKAIFAFDEVGALTEGDLPEEPVTVEHVVEPAFAAAGGGLVSEPDDEA